MLALRRFGRSKLLALSLSLSRIVSAQSQPPAAPDFPGAVWQLVHSFAPNPKVIPLPASTFSAPGSLPEPRPPWLSSSTVT